jgi:hypothetical protein
MSIEIPLQVQNFVRPINQQQALQDGFLTQQCHELNAANPAVTKQKKGRKYCGLVKDVQSK